MKIAQLSVTPYEPKFQGGPFAMGHVVQTALSGRMVAAELDDGTRLVTEICRAPTLPHDALARREDHWLHGLAGQSIADLPGIAARILVEDPMLIGLVGALDLAVLQASALRAGLPLWVLLGGAQQDSLPEIAAYGQMPPDALTQTLLDKPPDAPVVQIKLGCGDTMQDLACTRAALDALWADQRLIADFNGTLERSVARRVLAQIDDPRLIWEEPCTLYEDNLALARMLDVPVMLDQCLSSPQAYARALQDGVSHMALKPARLGGLGPARAVRDMTAAAGATLRVDGPFSGPIWAAANLHLALGCPAERMLGAMDTSAPLDLPHRPKLTCCPGRLAPPPGPGLGELGERNASSGGRG